MATLIRPKAKNDPERKTVRRCECHVRLVVIANAILEIQMCNPSQQMRPSRALFVLPFPNLLSCPIPKAIAPSNDGRMYRVGHLLRDPYSGVLTHCGRNGM